MPKDNTAATELALKNLSLKILLVFGMVLVVGLLCVAALFSFSSELGYCPIAIEQNKINQPTGRVGFTNTQIPITCVKLERTETPETQTKGLSGRSSMARDEGMLFMFKEPAVQCFWMKDMHFSLDMIWLDENRHIVKIERDVSPDTYPKSFCSDVPTQYVIELNSGVADQAKLYIGQQLNL
jgi:uncharacterized membrane protein (UPF0127 family)